MTLHKNKKLFALQFSSSFEAGVSSLSRLTLYKNKKFLHTVLKFLSKHVCVFYQKSRVMGVEVNQNGKMGGVVTSYCSSILRY